MQFSINPHISMLGPSQHANRVMVPYNAVSPTSRPRVNATHIAATSLNERVATRTDALRRNRRGRYVLAEHRVRRTDAHGPRRPGRIVGNAHLPDVGWAGLGAVFCAPNTALMRAVRTFID